MTLLLILPESSGGLIRISLLDIIPAWFSMLIHHLITWWTNSMSVGGRSSESYSHPIDMIIMNFVYHSLLNKLFAFYATTRFITRQSSLHPRSPPLNSILNQLILDLSTTPHVFQGHSAMKTCPLLAGIPTKILYPPPPAQFHWFDRFNIGEDYDVPHFAISVTHSGIIITETVSCRTKVCLLFTA
jgi:hypothetical protein